MKILNDIIQQFKNTYCFMGVHFWIYKTETIRFKLPGRNTFLSPNRHYRICSNCYKCQHSGIGMMGNKWFNEDDNEINGRSNIIRSIKLNKLIKKLS